MLALILIIVVTCFSMFVSCSIDLGKITWVDYYHGAMVGFLISGIILQVSNKWRRMKEFQKNYQSFISLIRNWN